MGRRGWHQRPHWRTSKRGRRFRAGRGQVKSYRYVPRDWKPPVWAARRPLTVWEKLIRNASRAALKRAIEAMACAAAPPACPAIALLNEASTFSGFVSTFYRAYRRAQAVPGGPARGVEAAGKEMADSALREVISRKTEPEIREASNAFGSASAALLSSRTGLDEDVVRRVAARTAHRAMQEGVGGLTSWGLIALGV